MPRTNPVPKQIDVFDFNVRELHTTDSTGKPQFMTILAGGYEDGSNRWSLWVCHPKQGVVKQSARMNELGGWEPVGDVIPSKPGEMAPLGGDIETLVMNHPVVQDLVARLDRLEQPVPSQDDRVDALLSTVGALEARIKALVTEVGGLKAQVASAKSPAPKDDTLTCVCGFEAKSPAGLAAHKRKCKVAIAAEAAAKAAPPAP